MTAVPEITRRRPCARVGCTEWYETPHDGPHPQRFCSHKCWQMDKPAPEKKPRARLRQSETVERKPVAVASKAQAAKRRAGASVVSGATEGLDAAHLCPRDLGGCGDALCTIPLTRTEHREFDAGERDLLGDLITSDCIPELQHALEHYRGDLIALIERVTGHKVVLEPRRDSRVQRVQ